MKLLFITQKVDREDDIFGFVHDWIRELSFEFESIEVICLMKGVFSLPENVRVWSLGKENTKSKIKQALNFYKYIWKLRKEYDIVFVHMNPIYIVLAGIFWKIIGKKVYLWFNHTLGSLVARVGIMFSKKVFYTSPFSFSSSFSKSEIMPAGINTDIFKRNKEIIKKKNSILFLGRISPVKNLDVLVKAAKMLNAEGIDFMLNIVGEGEKSSEDYFLKIKDLARDLEKKGKVNFVGKVANYKAHEIFNQNEVFVNLTPSGSFDKAMLEAMSCELLMIASSKALEKDLPEFLRFKEKDENDLKEKIKNVFNMPANEKEKWGKQLRSFVEENHNLKELVKKIVLILQNK